ncbi:MFS transporter [Pseudaestuariivita rosea]|uniref:MFS transporter n=1 Tax=Pseudaestuariivita rosea TaxID=2763263 RepID=UPI001ABA3E8C
MKQTNWAVVLLLWFAGILAAAQFGKISLVLTEMALAYDLSEATMSLAISCLSVVGILLGAVAGILVAGFGARPIILIALIVGAALSVLQSFLLPFPVLLGTRLIEGASHLALVVAAPTLMLQLSRPKDQSTIMGLWGTFFGLSFAVTAWILPSLIGIGGLPFVFIMHGAALMVLAVLLWALLPVTPRNRFDIKWVKEHVQLYSDARVVAPALGFFWHTLIFVALLTFLPDLISDRPWVAAALPLVSLAGTFTAGVLARFIPADRIVAVAMGLTIILMPFCQILPVALLAFFVIGLQPGGSFASVPYFNHSPAAIARANGAIAQLGNLGTASGTPLFALAIAYGGLTAVIVTTALICLIGLVCVLWIGFRAKRLGWA